MMFQQVDYQLRTLAYIIKDDFMPDKTTFVTPQDCQQQVGYIVYKKNDEIKRHTHQQIVRQIVGTTEVLRVLKGRCVVDFYDDSASLIASKELIVGDMIIIIAGGHGFRMLEDTVLLEVKQGPYPGLTEKSFF